MHLNKQQISTYIRCPFMLAIETALATPRAAISSVTLKAIMSKVQEIPLKEVCPYTRKINDIRSYLQEAASYELKNAAKFTLSEYRVKFTNKFYSKNTEVMDAQQIILNLNNLFEIFADNKFVGYNVPVDIPVRGTAIIYRAMVDFILQDEEENITVVELADLTDMDTLKKQMTHWAHYYAPYSFLAASFGKEIEVIIIDPVNFTRLSLQFKPERMDNDLKDLKLLASPMQSNNLVKNLFQCPLCDYKSYCH